MVSSRMQPPVLLWRLINLLLVLARLLAINWFLKRRVQGGKQAEGIGEAREHCGTDGLRQCQCDISPLCTGPEASLRGF